MSKFENRGEALQRRVQSKFDGQFDLKTVRWGSSEELTSLKSSETPICFVGVALVEVEFRKLVSIDQTKSVKEALEQHPSARTLLLVGRARDLQINANGAALKIFDLGKTNAK